MWRHLSDVAALSIALIALCGDIRVGGGASGQVPGGCAPLVLWQKLHATADENVRAHTL